MSEKTFLKPDFIGIGPPKTGTTWIYKNLSQHQQISMPPDKEIRYFYEKHFVGELGLLKLLLSDHWHVKGRRAFHKNRLRAHFKSLLGCRLDVHDLRWDLKYLFGNRSFSWYASLFNENCVSGDISAKYCELPEEWIRKIKHHFPRLKVLITLRDPVEREWSRAKMNLSKKPNRPLSTVKKHEFLTQFNDPPQKTSNDYKRVIESWSRYFPSEQILVLFYDELVEDPYGYFLKICRFLSIKEPDEEAKAKLEEYVFKGVKGGIPDEFRDILFEMHQDNILDLIGYYPDNDYPKRWLAKHQAHREIPVD